MRLLYNFITQGVLFLLIYVLTLFLGCIGLGPYPNTVVAAQAHLEPQELVRQGIDAYKQGRLEEARKTLEKAGGLAPADYAVPYYLGLIYLEQQNRREAINQWQKYVEMAPEDDTALNIRKNLTLLKRNAAEAFARAAVADEQKFSEAAVDKNAVAVTAFKNLGSENLAPLGKGMAAMIMADLSQFKSLKVVEREKLQALLTEMDLGASGLVDEKSAPKVGRLLRAQYVSSGHILDPAKEQLLITSALLDAVLNTTKANRETSGDLKKFYELEKEVACNIATELGQDCRTAPQAFGKIHTRSLPALTAYSYGLDYLDSGAYDEARVMFTKALEEDPHFDLAHAALLATPAAAMLFLTESQIISGAASNAPSSAATAAGTTATTAGTGATATTAGAGGLGIGTTAAVAGGAVVAGGAMAAVAGIGRNEDDTSQVSLAGQWRGVWNDQANGTGGTFVLNLTQKSNSIGGQAILNGCPCISSGDVTGHLANGRIVLAITAPDAGATLTAEPPSAHELTGTIEFTDGDCSGTAMNISVTQTGSAMVRW